MGRMLNPLAAALIASIAAPAMAQLGAPVTAGSPTISTLTTGTVLDVQATVSPDGRYVTMRVHPSFSQLEGIDMFNLSGQRLPGGVGGVGGGGGGGGTGGGGGGGVGGGGAGGGGISTNGAANLPAAHAVAPATPPKPAEPGSLIFVPTDKELLATPIPAMTLHDKSFKDAIKTLSDVSKKNIVLGYRGLELANVDVNAHHDFDVAQGTLRDALLSIIKTAAAKSDIVVSAEDGVAQIMSQSQADNIVVSKAYYVEDIVGNLPQILGNKPSADAKNAGQSKPSGSDSGPNYDDVVGYREPGRPAAILAAGGPTRYSTNIIEVITSTIRPEIWKVNGGKIGDIVVVGNQVNIRAPIAVHALLDGPKHYDPNARPLYIDYSPTSGAAISPP